MSVKSESDWEMRLTVPGSDERRDSSNNVESKEDLVPAVLDIRERRDVDDEESDHSKDTQREVELRGLFCEGMVSERLNVLQTHPSDLEFTADEEGLTYPV